MPNRNKIRSHGLVALLASHPEVRKLKRHHAPSVHGNKFWKSSWVLIDYFSRRGLPPGVRVMEVGCGWGLASIYCAKKHGAKVTGVDVDPEVFPYLKLHAAINEVQISTMKSGFAGLTGKHLRKFDVIVGTDICFWDSLVDPLVKLIRRALRAGVRLILIADPGRSPFEQMGEYFVAKRNGQIQDWTAQRPHRSEGRILKIENIEDLRL